MKFIRDKAHCRHEAYTKEEANNKMSGLVNEIDVYKKSDFAIVETTTTIRDTASNGVYMGSIMKSLPEGFDATNCVVISKMFGTDNAYGTETRDDIIYFSILTGDTYNTINGVLSTTDSTKAGQTYNVRIVLMKIA